MSKLHKEEAYQKYSNSIYSKFWNWSNRKWSVKTEFEIKDLQDLSLEAFKMAKFLEGKIAPKSNNLNLFENNCSLNRHDVKVWENTGNTIKDREPIMAGECSKCLANIVRYGNEISA